MWSPMDGIFGPQLPGQFDFTLFFEHVMLTIVPGGIIVLAIPFYVGTALRTARRVRPGFLLWFKLAVGLALLAVHTTSLIMWQRASLFRSDLSLSAAVMSLVASLCILVIIFIAHTYSLQPSTFLSVFLTITALFDITMTRSYFRRIGLGTIGALQISVVVLKIVLVVFEELPKRGLFLAESLRASAAAETVAGFWNRSVFGWLNSLLLFGYRKELSMDNLPSIDEHFDSMQLYDQFWPNWDRANRSSKFALAKAIFLTVSWQALKVIPPRLLFVGFTFSQPFLLFRVVSAVHQGADGDITHSLVGATALIFGGKTITRALYQHMSYRVGTSVRGILVVAIYDKMQRLPVEELKNSAGVTLMTTDTAAIQLMLELVYELWASAIQVALGIWSLSLYVGPACFLMLIPGLGSFIASHYLGIEMSTARAAWNGEMESRVAATSNILAQIKGIKSMGLSNTMGEYLQEKRRTEISTSMRERRCRIYLFALAAASFVLSPLCVLAGAIFWTRVSNPLNVAEVFTVLSIVSIASEPFMNLLISFIQWSAGAASLQRLHKYLCLDELQDMRQSPNTSQDEANSVTGEKSAPHPLGPRRSPFAVCFEVVAVTSTIIGPLLNGVSFQIPWGSLTMLWGPINCGKSTLLKCIIGETKLDSGVVTVGTKSIAYCDQQSWLQNRTVRENVIGILEYIEPWYREVVNCCGLDIDIMAFANGDQFMTGTGGCNLSGGQKQRVSLARAIYAQTDIMVLDDVLSALDPETAQLVFSRLFGPDGLVQRWNCTVIMTTNQLHFLEDANLIFRMYKGGRVELQQHEISDGSSAASSDCEDGVRAPARPAVTAEVTEPPSVKLPIDDNLELQNAREKRKGGDWSLYTYYMGPAGVFWVVSWICVVAVAAVMEQMPTILVRIWYNKDADNHHFFVGFVALSLTVIVMNSLNGVVFFYRILPQTSDKMHYRLTRTIMSATLQYLGQTDSGTLLNKFSQDLFLTSQYLPITMTQFVYMIFTATVEIGVIAAGSPYTAPVMVFLTVTLYLVQYFYLRTSRQLRLLELESTSGLFTHLTETSTGIQHIRSFGWQLPFRKQLCDILNLSQKPFYFLYCCQRWLHVVLDFISSAAALVLVSVSLTVPQVTSGGAVGLALLNLIGFNGTTSFLISSWANLETGLGAVARIKTCCDETPLEQDTLSGPEVTEDWPTDGRLDFNCLSAEYQAEDGTVQRALNNLSFTILPGEKVGISGRTGSGKSSIFMAILRMVEFTGTISIDGRNTTSVPRELLRSRITTLTQDGVELKETLRFNVYPFPGKQPEDEEIISTLQSVGLWDDVNRHGGLDTKMTSMRFSVSNKQLLFLARGILHQRTMNTKVVVMDEVTSAMDYGTDNRLQEILDEAFAGCTVLQIAHRQDSFRAVDVRIRLESGKLASFERRRR